MSVARAKSWLLAARRLGKWGAGLSWCFHHSCPVSPRWCCRLSWNSASKDKGIWNDCFNLPSTDFLHTQGHGPHRKSTVVTLQMTLQLFHSDSTPNVGHNYPCPHSLWWKDFFCDGWGMGSLPGFLPRSCLPDYYPGIDSAAHRQVMPTRPPAQALLMWEEKQTALHRTWLKGGSGVRNWVSLLGGHQLVIM